MREGCGARRMTRREEEGGRGEDVKEYGGRGMEEGAGKRRYDEEQGAQPRMKGTYSMVID